MLSWPTIGRSLEKRLYLQCRSTDVPQVLEPDVQRQQSHLEAQGGDPQEMSIGGGEIEYAVTKEE